MNRASSLLLALLGHVLHHFLLVALGFLHLLHVDVLHELVHQERDANHDHERVLQVGPGVKRGLYLVVAVAAAGVQLQRVDQAVVFALGGAEQEGLGVLALLELFCVDVHHDGLEVKVRVYDLHFVAPWARHLDVKVALAVDKTLVHALLHRDMRLCEVQTGFAL